MKNPWLTTAEGTTAYDNKTRPRAPTNGTCLVKKNNKIRSSRLSLVRIRLRYDRAGGIRGWTAIALTLEDRHLLG